MERKTIAFTLLVSQIIILLVLIIVLSVKGDAFHPSDIPPPPLKTFHFSSNGLAPDQATQKLVFQLNQNLPKRVELSPGLTMEAFHLAGKPSLYATEIAAVLINGSTSTIESATVTLNLTRSGTPIYTHSLSATDARPFRPGSSEWMLFLIDNPPEFDDVSVTLEHEAVGESDK